MVFSLLFVYFWISSCAFFSIRRHYLSFFRVFFFVCVCGFVFASTHIHLYYAFPCFSLFLLLYLFLCNFVGRFHIVENKTRISTRHFGCNMEIALHRGILLETLEKEDSKWKENNLKIDGKTKKNIQFKP